MGQNTLGSLQEGESVEAFHEQAPFQESQLAKALDSKVADVGVQLYVRVDPVVEGRESRRVGKQPDGKHVEKVAVDLFDLAVGFGLDRQEGCTDLQHGNLYHRVGVGFQSQ